MSHVAASRDPIADEAASVSALAVLRHDVEAVDGLRLLYGQNPLVRKIGDTDSSQFSPLAPRAAKATLSRSARAREQRRRLQVRSHGMQAFLRAIK